MNSQKELISAINDITKKRNSTFDTPAVVLRVEGETAWVHIDGGADETPALKTINCSEGETVQVRISNGNAFLVGNASAPPTDDKTANAAHLVAEQADIKAVKAEETATEVKETVEVLEVEVDGKVDIGSSNIQHLSSTMYQNANGVNIYNDDLAVGDSYAHIDGDSFDIKVCTTAGQIDDVNDTMLASFGREVTIGTRATGSTVGQYSHVFGYNCTASSYASHAEGFLTEASGPYSHAEGRETAAGGMHSHAEGAETTTSGSYSHSEGYKTVASGEGSHAEGWLGTAIGRGAHAENNGKAVGLLSHAEGNAAYSNGDYSHAEGGATEANGEYSHAEGSGCEANGKCSHAQNYDTIAEGDYQTAIGKLNKVDYNNSFAYIIGNGYVDSGGIVHRSNALAVGWNGDILTDGTLQDLNGVSLLDEWTPTATVSSGSITFNNLDDSLDYSRPYFENGFYNVTAMTKSGSGTSTSLTFTTDAPDNTVGKLRIIR